MHVATHHLVRRAGGLPQPACEVVEGAWTVPLFRELIEVPTGDGVRLVCLRKRPAVCCEAAQRSSCSHRRGAALLIHGFGQNRYAWDLRQRSLANYLVAHGYEVFLAELRGHGLSRAHGAPYPDSFETHVLHDLPALVRHVVALSGEPRIFYLGHSLGGTLAYCAGPSLQQHLRGIVSLAGPLHLGRGLRLLPALAAAIHRLASLSPVPLWRRLPYLSVDLFGALLAAGLPFFDSPLRPAPLRLWYPRSIESPILLETLRRSFDRAGIPVAEFLVRWAATGRLVSSCGTVDYERSLERLEVPILFAVGAQDAVVSRASIQTGYERAGSADKVFRVFDSGSLARGWGHLDIVCGKAAPQVVWPTLLQWMAQH
jgi:pimeloyl-ACP methyl ester carboxylesterase